MPDQPITVLERVKRWLRYFSKAKNLPVPPPKEGAALFPRSVRRDILMASGRKGVFRKSTCLRRVEQKGWAKGEAESAALQTQFAVGTEAHQFKAFGVRLAVNEDQVGAKMAVAVIFPFAQ